jgi:hypothetical protein
MDRRDFIRAVSLFSALGAAGLAPGASSRRLNLVFFLTDDLGWADVGYKGSRFYDTPAIDRLASQGMVFTDAYAASPVCSPTRASIMTGKYPARLGLTDFIGGHRKGKIIPPQNLDHLPLEEVTIAEALAKAHAEREFVEFRRSDDRNLESDFDRAVKGLPPKKEEP